MRKRYGRWMRILRNVILWQILLLSVAGTGAYLLMTAQRTMPYGPDTVCICEKAPAGRRRQYTQTRTENKKAERRIAPS